MNHPQAKATPSAAGIPKGECCNCRLKDRRLFHQLLIRGMARRVCTSCVLRLHPSFFCPYCFEFFEHPVSKTSASAHRFVSCTKCSSLTHLDCLPSPPPPPSAFLCPPCSKPSFSFFPDSNTSLDKRLALVLLCACKVAAASAAKSLALARVRVDRTSRESALASKRVREALDHCSILDEVKRKRLEAASIEVSNSRNLGTNHNGNGFIGQGQGQGQVKVPSEVLPLPRPVNNNGNRERSCQGRVVDATSAKFL